jgi:hypothetical protein
MMLRLLPCLLFLLFQGMSNDIPRWEDCQCTHHALERVHRATRVLLENWRLDLLINSKTDATAVLACKMPSRQYNS